jgi:anti-sigma factor RsiW
MRLPDELTCQELVELATDYLEGGLAPDERLRFEVHIARCPGCPSFLDQIRRTLTVASTLSEELPPEVERHLLDAFRHWKSGV